MNATAYLLVMSIVGLMVALICVRRYGNDDVQAFLESNFFKAIVALIAAVVMYYTPDDIDRIIIAFLGVFGIAPLLSSNNDDQYR